MTIKVHELAKELNMNSKDLTEKINSFGIEVKSYMSTLGEKEEKTVREKLGMKSAQAKPAKTDKETKIVKVEPKKADIRDQEPRVVVKAANIKLPTAPPKPRHQEKTQEKQRTQKPPIGKPVVDKDLDNRVKPPVGKPVVAKDLDNRVKPPIGKPIVSKTLEEREKNKNEGQVATKVTVPENGAESKKEPPTAAETVQKVETSAGTEDRRLTTEHAEKNAETKTAEKDMENTKTAAQKESVAAAEEKKDTTGQSKTGTPAAARAESDKRQEESSISGDGQRRQWDQQRSGGERTERSARGDRGDRSDRSDRGDRSDRYGDRPQRQGDQQRSGNDRSDRGDRNDRNDRGDRGGRYGDRPQRQGDQQRGNDRNDRGDRGDRNDRGDRGGRYGDRPQRQGDQQRGNDRGDRGARDNRGDRNDRNDRNDRGDRGGRYGDRPQRQGDRPARPGERSQGREEKPAAIMGNGKTTKREDRHKTEKERDKFAKLEGGKPKSKNYSEKSLEKAAKPKKHIKKEKQVEAETINMEELPTGTVVINVPITVAGFCEQTKISTSVAIMALMKLGIMANINQNLDEDTVMILAEEAGVPVVVGKVQEEVVEEGLETFEDKEEDLKTRSPIITVMGHVDHGKTSLLDAIRKTNVTASESGGITQHIGASEVTINGQKIVFLDTPGHEAFTAMRARGAHVTDIAVLVVAADDSVKPQTIESISHAKAAGVPIIVAINKMDKPGANPDKVKQDLTEHGILVEEWGGETIAVPVSAKSGEGIVNLLEMILLQAEVLELKANPNRLAMGTVVEARLDKAKGPVATLLVLNGTLQTGMSIVAGTCAGRIRLMTNHKGDVIKKAGPATAVEILGLTEVPEAGDEFNAVKEDRTAKDIAEKRKIKLREEVLARNASTTLEQLFSQIKEGEVKELNLIVKGDVMGSVGAIESSLEKLRNENVRVKIIHSGVGTINESDVMLAGTAGAVIIGFNVRPSSAVTAMAERENIQIRTYRVIYDVIDDVENAMKGMLDPVYKEVILGKVEIRDTFKVPGVGIIGGAYVTEGKVVRNAGVRLVRDGIVIHEGKISSLKRFKDDAKEVNQGYECGIGIENYNDIKEGDIIECFEMQEIERK